VSIIAFSVSLVIAIKHNSVFVLSPLKQEQTTTSNFLLYENSTYGIKIQYPSGWDKIEDGIREGTKTNIIAFFPASAANSNASLDISIDDISGENGISLARYANNSLSDLKGSLTNFKLIESSANNNIVFAGIPAYKLVYSSTDRNSIVKDMEIGAMQGNKVYTLTYEAGVNEYDKYLPIMQKMIGSFQITK
jgi:eukaryotic-like serine/threonine-protein kinase